jgi:hypothetical protein
MTEDQLLTHARRCNSLADVCIDPIVATKLRALARDYWVFSKCLPDRPITDDCPELVPPQGGTDAGTSE